MKKKQSLALLLGSCLMLTGCAPAKGAAVPAWIFGLLGVAVLTLAVVHTGNYIRYTRKSRHARRKQAHHTDPITVGLYAVGGAFLLLALIFALAGGETPTDTDGSDNTAATETTGPQWGWESTESGQRYKLEDGSYAIGWLELENKQYYLDAQGLTLSGWQEVEGMWRYFRADGSMARGEEEIAGVTYFFTSTGAQVEVANPWNTIPEGYVVQTKDLSVVYAVAGIKVDQRIYDPLIKMMKACNQAMAEEYPNNSPRCCVTSGYRTLEDQTRIYNNRVKKYLNEGYAQDEAEAAAATAVAVPGTSEHQLGLAVDIVDTQSWNLNEFQEDLPAQKWLMAHCWEYGFILRYPEGKTDVTGIIYEPWHYRYVGTELALELRDSGLTLEEYLQNLD